ncbi:hypothetical protein EVAR_14323_1 [Eumeta japonica]|uniref:Uncharacterized protein n=1 Tax=Eumeta variegata TaxID=151549 RepID=A0A4C1UNE6_EUMVA|nr:hypothetical protein EVAR_14323_1 [Eumeta japonica]
MLAFAMICEICSECRSVLQSLPSARGDRTRRRPSTESGRDVNLTYRFITLNSRHLKFSGLNFSTVEAFQTGRIAGAPFCDMNYVKMMRSSNFY